MESEKGCFVRDSLLYFWLMQNEFHMLSDSLSIQDDGANFQSIEHAIQQLINHDQQRLVWLLYRFDVDEAKVKRLLSEVDDDAAKVITTQLLNRCKQTIATRKANQAKSTTNWSFDV